MVGVIDEGSREVEGGNHVGTGGGVSPPAGVGATPAEVDAGGGVVETPAEVNVGGGVVETPSGIGE